MDSSSDRNPVEELAEEFVGRYRRGERPTVREYAKRYPQWAEQINALFRALLVMEKVRPDADASADGNGGTVRAHDARKLERLGDYRILREVGRGGMGVVYEAEQESLGRHVALKVFPGHGLLDPRHLQRFHREAKAVARLHHSNIVPVHGVGEQDGLHYYVMQFIHGLGLDAVLDELRRLRHASPGRDDPVGDRRPPLAAEVARTMFTGALGGVGHAGVPPTVAPGAAPEPAPVVLAASNPVTHVERSSSVHLPGQAEGALSDSGRQYWRSVARVGIQVADALGYAAGQGVLHRDIKPSNLLLDTRGTVWVTDFGLAKADTDQDNLTHTGDILGTLRYMAPERFSGRGDVRSDLYSLGLTLYELVALRPAFPEGDRNKLMAQVMRDEPPPLRLLQPAVPRDLETIITKAVAREPARRYQTPAELADDLQRFLEDRPIRARPVGRAERLWRWCKRNPAVAGLTATAAGLLVVVAAVASAGYLAEARQRAAAEHNERVADEARKAAQREADWNRRLLYDADMQLAAQLWESETGTAKAVADLLDAHAPRAGEEDLCDFAWRYQCHLLRRGLMLGHVGSCMVGLARDGALVTHDQTWTVRYWGKVDRRTSRPLRSTNFPRSHAVAFASDGITVALGNNEDGTLAVCDASTGTHRTWQAGAGVWDLVFSGDGTKLVSVHVDNQAKLWDVAGGTLVGTHRLPSHAFRELAASPDGRTLVLANHPGNAEMSVVRFGTTGMRTLRGQGSTVTCVAFSPDGRTLASGDGHVILWDAATWSVRERFYPKGGWVSHLAFARDGRRLATGGSDGHVEVWDVGEPRRLRRLKGHTGPITDLAFGPDGTTLASGSRDGTARLWDLRSESEGRLLGGVPAYLHGAAFSRDGKWLATGGGRARLWDARTETLRFELADAAGSLAFSPDGTLLATRAGPVVRLWDVATGRLVRTLAGRSPAPEPAQQAAADLAFSPDGKLLAAGFGVPNLFVRNYRQAVQVWDVASGAEVAALPHANTVPALAFLSGGDVLATACHDQNVRLWDVGTWQVVRKLPVGATVSSLAACPNSPLVAAGTWHGEIQLWDARSEKLLNTLPGHANTVSALAFSPDGKMLASASFDRTIKWWGVASGRELRTLTRHTDWVYCLAFSPDGSRLASSSGDGTLRLWDAPSARADDARTVAATPHDERQLACLTAHVGGTTMAAFAPDGKTIASVGDDGTVRLWDWPPGRLRQTLRGHRGGLLGLAYAPDGRTLASASRDGTATLWDAATGRQLFVLADHADGVEGVAFSPDGKLLATASFDRTVKVWDTATGIVRFTFRLREKAVAVVFSRDGRTLVSGGGDWTAADRQGEVKAWDLQTGGGRLSIPGQFGGVWGLGLSPDGQTVAGGCLDGTVRLWDLATGREKNVLRGHSDRILGVAFTPDGKLLASSSFDGTLRFWDVATGRECDVLRGHLGSVNRFALSGDGRLLASTGSDTAVRVWRLDGLQAPPK